MLAACKFVSKQLCPLRRRALLLHHRPVDSPFADCSAERVFRLRVTCCSWCLLFAALLLAGCQSAPYVNQHIEAVNSEYRELETYSYELERENKQLCDELKMLEDENTRLRGGAAPAKRPGTFSSPARSTPRTTPRTTPRVDLTPPNVDVPDIVIPDSPAPSLPPVIPPKPLPFRGGASSSGTGVAPRNAVSSQKPAENTLPLLPSAPQPPRPILEDPPPSPIDKLPNDLPTSELPPPVKAPAGVVPEVVDPRVTHLFLNPLLTRGANFDAQPGDDGLALVLEPRNQAGEFVPTAAPVSIVVLDPTKTGDAARLAKWSLDEKLVRQRISRSSGTRGIHLQLPWSGGAPESNQVKLYVRYETADGRRIEAQHDLLLNPAAHASQRWTPRPGDRPRAAVPAMPVVNTPVDPAPTITTANPPLPAPPVHSELTSPKVIHEPAAPQTSVADKGGTTKPPAQPENADRSPPLLTPPPRQPAATPAPQRPEWQPFR